jgi:cell division transport system ATP-binding protein
MIYFDILPSIGEINVLGYNSSKTKSSKFHRLRKKIGVIFQDYKLLQQRTVYENIALPLHINGVGRKKIKDNVEEALELADLADYQNKYPNELSGGEQQRVCIARAIVKNPELILADEPTGNLDPAAAHKILKILEQINKEGTTVVMATHNYKLISDRDNRIIELKAGILVSS